MESGSEIGRFPAKLKRSQPAGLSTFGNFNLQIESHIFNFNEQVYGKSITIEFLTRIRDEKKFETVEKLIENIKMDVIFAEKYFKDLKI